MVVDDTIDGQIQKLKKKLTTYHDKGNQVLQLTQDLQDKVSTLTQTAPEDVKAA